MDKCTWKLFPYLLKKWPFFFSFCHFQLLDPPRPRTGAIVGGIQRGRTWSYLTTSPMNTCVWGLGFLQWILIMDLSVNTMWISHYSRNSRGRHCQLPIALAKQQLSLGNIFKGSVISCFFYCCFLTWRFNNSIINLSLSCILQLELPRSALCAAFKFFQKSDVDQQGQWQKFISVWIWWWSEQKLEIKSTFRILLSAEQIQCPG